MIQLTILAGIFASIFAYLCNKLVLKALGERAIVALVPFIEEMGKSGAAILMQSNIFGTHLVFGVVEGVYDIVVSKAETGKLAALFSVFSHGIFGMITQVTYNRSGSFYVAVLVAWLFHSLWNWLVQKYL